MFHPSLHALWIVAALATWLPAQKPDAKSPRPLEVSDVKNWQRIVGFRISPDGKWCGYFQRPNEGDGKFIIKQVDGDKDYKFSAGSGSGSLAFAHNSQWVAFRSQAPEKAAKAARKAKKPVPTKVVLVKLEDGTKIEFERASRFAFSGEAATWLAIQKSAPEGRPSGDKGWKGTDLILHELASGTQMNLGNVAAFAFNKSGKWLAMTIDAQGKAGNGLQLVDMSDKRLSMLESDQAVYKSMSWTKEGDALALLKEQKSDDYEEKLHHLLAFRNFDGDQPEKTLVDPAKDAGIPEHMTISPNRQPRWTRKRDGLVFGIHDAKKKDKPKSNKDEDGDEEDDDGKGDKSEDSKKSDDVEEAGVVIWHWKDKRLQSRQQVQESQDKQYSYLCLHRLKEGKTLQLANDEMRQVSLAPPHRFAIAQDTTKYELASSLNGRRFSDVYVIDLKTGKKKLALKKNRWLFGMSPLGDRFLYFQDGHFHTYNMANGKRVNITEDAPVSFVDVEDDHNVKDRPISPIGWTKDGRVLLSDAWDIWLVPAVGGDAVNLTVDGKAKQIRYRRRVRLDPDEEGIDLNQPVYVSMYGEWTKKAGYGRIVDGTPGVEKLLWDDAGFRSLAKVEDQDVYYFTRETESSSPNYHVAGPDLDQARQVTDANTQQKHFKWSDGARLVDYESANGDKLQAALFLPADYVEGKTYPTIVLIYEKLSQRLHSYEAPRTGGFSTAIYTSRGYAVLMPDIVYQLNQPGKSSVACVLPAVEAAVATGVVDETRIGLHGHSWGGYQTAYLITQTNRFKAAVAGAPLTNLISMYSSIYWNSGRANQPIFESSQGRFTNGYWSNLKAYAANSPVYHARKVKTPLLLLHNDKDGAVDWNQGIEYFNTLRRLRKPVVMLQYTGENHGVVKLPNRKDYSYRMLEFFDHHLRGKPAPKWWSEGVKHLDLKDHIKAHREKQADD